MVLVICYLLLQDALGSTISILVLDKFQPKQSILLFFFTTPGPPFFHHLIELFFVGFFHFDIIEGAIIFFGVLDVSAHLSCAFIDLLTRQEGMDLQQHTLFTSTVWAHTLMVLREVEGILELEEGRSYFTGKNLLKCLLAWGALKFEVFANALHIDMDIGFGFGEWESVAFGAINAHLTTEVRAIDSIRWGFLPFWPILFMLGKLTLPDASSALKSPILKLLFRFLILFLWRAKRS